MRRGRRVNDDGRRGATRGGRGGKTSGEGTKTQTYVRGDGGGGEAATRCVQMRLDQ